MAQSKAKPAIQLMNGMRGVARRVARRDKVYMASVTHNSYACKVSTAMGIHEQPDSKH
jgi:hypothetical protein